MALVLFILIFLVGIFLGETIGTVPSKVGHFAANVTAAASRINASLVVGATTRQVTRLVADEAVSVRVYLGFNRTPANFKPRRIIDQASVFFTNFILDTN